MPINETFNGFIETTTDALLIFEACRRGILPKISRRLQDRERGAIRSGTIYVFDEKESGIRRWTDGLVWSPSRILGNFLIYRELDGRESLHQKQHMEASTSYMANYYTSTSIYDPASEDSLEEQLSSEERDRERNLVGSLTDTYKFKKGGLIKKTISIHLNGSIQHLISYYTKTDVLDAKLATPSSVSEISSLQIAPDLLLKQSFRVPPSVEFAELILKRPSLSPSSTISSASSSTQSYYRKSYGNMKPGTPYSLHDGYRRRYHHHKDLQYEDYHSLPVDHSRRLSLESNMNKRQMRAMRDASEESLRRRSSFLTHPIFDSPTTADNMHTQYSERNDARDAAHMSVRHHSFSGQSNSSMIENNAYQNMVTTTVASSASAFVPVLNNEDRDIYQPKRTSGGNNFYQKENVMDSNSRCYMTTTSTPSNSSSPTQTYRPQTDRMIPSFIEIPPQKENSNTYYNRYSPSLPSPSSLIWSNSQHQNEVSKPFISENTTTTPNTNTSYFGYNSPSYLKQMNGTTSPTENDYTNSQYHDKNKANFYTPYRTSYQTQQAQNNNIPFSSAHVMYPDQQFK